MLFRHFGRGTGFGRKKQFHWLSKNLLILFKVQTHYKLFNMLKTRMVNILYESDSDRSFQISLPWKTKVQYVKQVVNSFFTNSIVSAPYQQQKVMREHCKERTLYTFSGYIRPLHFYQNFFKSLARNDISFSNKATVILIILNLTMQNICNVFQTFSMLNI